MNWQEIIVFGLFMVAVWYLIHSFRKSISPKNEGCTNKACGGNCKPIDFEKLIQKTKTHHQSPLVEKD